MIDYVEVTDEFNALLSKYEGADLDAWSTYDLWLVIEILETVLDDRAQENLLDD